MGEGINNEEWNKMVAEGNRRRGILSDREADELEADNLAKKTKEKSDPNKIERENRERGTALSPEQRRSRLAQDFLGDTREIAERFGHLIEVPGKKIYKAIGQDAHGKTVMVKFSENQQAGGSVVDSASVHSGEIQMMAAQGKFTPDYQGVRPGGIWKYSLDPDFDTTDHKDLVKVGDSLKDIKWGKPQGRQRLG